MANEGNLICGLIPQADAQGQIRTRSKVPVSAAVNVDISLFRGTPYIIFSGSILGLNGNADDPCSGCIVKLYDSGGEREVTNLPNATDGFADVTFAKDQLYHIVASGTGFADDDSDNGKTYGLTTESATASANGFDGSSNSSVQMDTTAESATDNTFLAAMKVNKPRNIGGADRTLIEGTINPAKYSAW